MAIKANKELIKYAIRRNNPKEIASIWGLIASSTPVNQLIKLCKKYPKMGYKPIDSFGGIEFVTVEEYNARMLCRLRMNDKEGIID